MSIKNYYNGNNASGTTLTDLVGSSNGTLAGASLPTIKTGGTLGSLTFLGGHGNTEGDYNRVDIPKTDFEYAYNESFSTVTISKTTKSDANHHTVMGLFDGTGLQALLHGYDIGEKVTMLVKASSTQVKYSNETIANDGCWKLMILSYSTNDLKPYLNAKLQTLSIDQTISSGEFFAANSKFILGARYNHGTGNYYCDLTGEIALFINFDEKLSANDVCQLQKEYIEGHGQ